MRAEAASAVISLARTCQEDDSGADAVRAAAAPIESNLAARLKWKRMEKTGAVSVVPPSRIERETSRSTI